MIDLRYNVSQYRNRTFKAVDLSKIKGIDRLRKLYDQSLKDLHVTQQSLYSLEYYIFSKIAKLALMNHMKNSGLVSDEDKSAFLKSQATKVVIKEAMQELGVQHRPHLFNIIQTMMLADLGVELTSASIDENMVWNEGIERKTAKPTATLNKIIKECRDKLEAEGFDGSNPYLIVREIEGMAFKKYRGDNYLNQLKRMGIESTHDYLAYVEYVLQLEA